jgi:hypothetical protein
MNLNREGRNMNLDRHRNDAILGNGENRKVVNLSSRELEPIEMNILKKGLNFSLAPKTIPVDSILGSIEYSIQSLTYEGKESIRQDCAVISKREKPPMNNISIDEFMVLKNLKDNTNLVIMKAVKGGTIVIMKSEEYKPNMIEHLTLSGSYRRLVGNPITRITREVKKVIKDSNLDELTKKHLLPGCEITPSIYGLQNIHKERIPSDQSSTPYVFLLIN